MQWYYYIAWALIISQLLFLFYIGQNYRYVMKRYQRDRTYNPSAVLIVPCKGLEPTFSNNIASLFAQDYENYILWFVVSDEQDPAYSQLCKLKQQLAPTSKARDVRILVAGSPSGSCSQKVHNLLYCYRNIPQGVEVLAFADSDICANPDWLGHLVWRLRKDKYGASTGYRWFVPEKNNLASLAMSAINAKVAQQLGDAGWNQAWGGSMAIRVEVFRRLRLDEIWAKSVSDDLSLSRAVKKAGLMVAFAPACLVASHESVTWPGLFEFARRQFVITRIAAPKAWLLALFSSLYSVLGFWGTAAIAVWAWHIHANYYLFYVLVPLVFFFGQLGRAIARQTMISHLLSDERDKMRAARTADICLFWLWSIILLGIVISSAFGRTIRWRGIHYRLLGPTRTIVVDRQ